MKPALLVIDMQKRYFGFGPAFEQPMKNAAEYINAAIDLFRKKNLPIIVIEHQEKEEGFVPGIPDFPTIESIKLLPEDLRLAKTYGNSFTKTPLAEHLRSLGVDTVIITGFCAEYCVLSTYRGALDLDLTPIILRGSLASDNPEHMRFVEEISDTITYGALKTML